MITLEQKEIVELLTFYEMQITVVSSSIFPENPNNELNKLMVEKFIKTKKILEKLLRREYDDIEIT